MAEKARGNPPSFQPQLLPAPGRGKPGVRRASSKRPSCPLINHRYLQILILSNTAAWFRDRLKVGSSPCAG